METYALISDKQWKYIQKHYQLTPRELEVAKLACQGLTNQEIAKRLSISFNTVKIHLRNIYRRVHVNTKILLLLKFVQDLKSLTNLE